MNRVEENKAEELEFGGNGSLQQSGTFLNVKADVKLMQASIEVLAFHSPFSDTDK